MRPGISLALAVAVLIGSIAQAGQTNYASQRGSWIMNKAESKIPPDTITPSDAPIVVTQDDGNALKFVVYFMTTTGFQPGVTYEGAYDGKPYPYGKDATRSFTRVSPTSYRTDWKSADGSSTTEVVTFIGGNSKMRFEGKGIDKSGKAFDYVQVWDKMQ